MGGMNLLFPRHRRIETLFVQFQKYLREYT